MKNLTELLSALNLNQSAMDKEMEAFKKEIAKANEYVSADKAVKNEDTLKECAKSLRKYAEKCAYLELLANTCQKLKVKKLSEEQEAIHQQELNENIEKMYNRTDPLYVSVFDKVFSRIARRELLESTSPHVSHFSPASTLWIQSVMELEVSRMNTMSTPVFAGIPVRDSSTVAAPVLR